MDGSEGTREPEKPPTSACPAEQTPEGAQLTSACSEETPPARAQASTSPDQETPERAQTPAGPEKTPERALSVKNLMGLWLSRLRWRNYGEENSRWGCNNRSRRCCRSMDDSDSRQNDGRDNVGAEGDGIRVHDNLVTGDPSNVVFGRGNRAGGRLTGEVSGNRVLR